MSGKFAGLNTGGGVGFKGPGEWMLGTDGK